MDTRDNKGKVRVPVKIGELIREEGRVIRLKIHENAELDAPDIEEVFAKGKELAGGQPFYLLTDARTSLYATKEAREYAAENLRAYGVIANAILTDSLPVALLANFYIKINRPEVPTQLFNTESRAIAWLNALIDREQNQGLEV